VRALAIGALTDGFDRSHARATAEIDAPWFFAMASSASMVAQPVGVIYSLAASARTDSTVTPGRYFPVRKPFARP